MNGMEQSYYFYDLVNTANTFNVGDEIWFDFPHFIGPKFSNKNYSTILKLGLKFYFNHYSYF